MVIQIREKEFKINLVNNYVHKIYGEMEDAVEEITTIITDIETVDKEYKAGDLDKSTFKQKVREINKKRKDISKLICDMRMDIIKELVVSNGYEFDITWWDHKTDKNDLNNFVHLCITKDLSDTKGNKKKES